MTKAVEVADGWTPVLSADGQFYCSPRCGGGRFCRKEWYDRAVSEGDALAAVLGDGWAPRVWENLGWHYEVHKGAATVHVHRDHRDGTTSYSAWIEARGAHPQIIAHAADPHDALGFAVQDARTLIARPFNESLASIADPTP
jgi:hypothetical protein